MFMLYLILFLSLPTLRYVHWHYVPVADNEALKLK